MPLAVGCQPDGPRDLQSTPSFLVETIDGIREIAAAVRLCPASAEFGISSHPSHAISFTLRQHLVGMRTRQESGGGGSLPVPVSAVDRGSNHRYREIHRAVGRTRRKAISAGAVATLASPRIVIANNVAGAAHSGCQPLTGRPIPGISTRRALQCSRPTVNGHGPSARCFRYRFPDFNYPKIMSRRASISGGAVAL